MDNLKVYNKDQYQITKLDSYLSRIYSKKLAVKRGKVHDYTGMEFDYSEDGSVKVSMIKHTGNILIASTKNILVSAASTSEEHLSKVRDDKYTKYLPEEQAKNFHHTTAHLLFMCSRACRDIKTEVEFITTRVNQTNADEWGKLKMLLKYLNVTRHMKLKLTLENMSLIIGWADASYNVYWYSRLHNGAMETLGKVSIIIKSKKKNLNVNSSTEGELVTTHD